MGLRILITNDDGVYAPGIAILLTALAFNALGESLRTYLDPTMKGL